MKMKGDVHGILIVPFREAYDRMAKIQEQRIIENFSSYDNEILMLLADSVLDSHKTRRPPTSDEIRQHLPSRAYDSERARKDIAALDAKDDELKAIAEQKTIDFMKTNELARRALSEGWWDKLRRVVWNLEWIRAQIKAEKSCIAWDGMDAPLPYKPADYEKWIKLAIKSFRDNVNRSISFSEKTIEHLSSYVE